MFGGASSTRRAGCLPMRLGDDGGPSMVPTAVDKALLAQFAAAEQIVRGSGAERIEKYGRLQQAKPRNDSLELDFLISCGDLAVSFKRPAKGRATGPNHNRDELHRAAPAQLRRPFAVKVTTGAREPLALKGGRAADI